MQVLKRIVVHCNTVVEAGANLSVVLSLLDPDDPFEIDEANGPHLAAEQGLGLEDALDVLFGDPEFYDDDSGGSADWLMVGLVPGGEVLVVPLAQARNSGFGKLRPITVLPAPLHIEQRYFQDKGE